jgi:hypothetical protein
LGEDDKERRVVRARPPRNAPAAERPPDKPSEFATGSSVFGRGMPEGVKTAMREMRAIHRDESASIPFGQHTLTVEQRYGLIVLVLPDGSRATGTPEQAAELARVLASLTKAPREP